MRTRYQKRKRRHSYNPLRSRGLLRSRGASAGPTAVSAPTIAHPDTPALTVPKPHLYGTPAVSSVRAYPEKQQLRLTHCRNEWYGTRRRSRARRARQQPGRQKGAWRTWRRWRKERRLANESGGGRDEDALGCGGKEGRAALTTRPQNRARASAVTLSRTAAQTRSQAGVVTATHRHALIPFAAGQQFTAPNGTALVPLASGALGVVRIVEMSSAAPCVRASEGHVPNFPTWVS